MRFEDFTYEELQWLDFALQKVAMDHITTDPIFKPINKLQKEAADAKYKKWRQNMGS